jgi:hypothetical protein
MRTFGAAALAALFLIAVNGATTSRAEARISCSSHYGCIEGKSARKPIRGMQCRTSASHRPGNRYPFFCSLD